MRTMLLALAMTMAVGAASPLAAQTPPPIAPAPAATPVPAPATAPGAPSQAVAPAPPAIATPIPSLPRVAIDTTEGRFVLALETVKAPVTAGNFLKYVDGKRLDGTIVYRVSHVADHFGFIQFGTNGDPKRILPPIRHEPTTVTGVKHLDGTISTARLAPGTARGEFTIMLGDQPGMDADPSKPGDNLGYAAFGHVIEGMDVVERIFNAPNDPAATVRGSFKGEVPAKPVRIVTARRVKP